jgi:hypothetical protein
MADIATSRASHAEKAEGADSTILLIATAGLLALFPLIVALHPPGVGHGPEYLPWLLGV